MAQVAALLSRGAARCVSMPHSAVSRAPRMQTDVPGCSQRAFGSAASCSRPRSSRAWRVAATTEPIDVLKYGHIVLALIDSNPALSSASRTAVSTAASLAARDKSKLTVLFVDDSEGEADAETAEATAQQRIQLVQGELAKCGVENFDFAEERVEHSVGKGSVAVGEVVDTLGADLLMLHTEAVHARHVDANLLAEFVPCPVLLLP